MRRPFSYYYYFPLILVPLWILGLILNLTCWVLIGDFGFVAWSVFDLVMIAIYVPWGLYRSGIWEIKKPRIEP